MHEYKENTGNNQVLLNITMGLKYIRIKVSCSRKKPLVPFFR